MSFPAISPAAGPAPCSLPQHLPLVDAAHQRPSGPAATQLRDQLCSRCTIRTACLDHALEHGELGAWGGVSQNVRTRARNRRAQRAQAAPPEPTLEPEPTT